MKFSIPPNEMAKIFSSLLTKVLRMTLLTNLYKSYKIYFVSCADVAQLVEQLIRNEQKVKFNEVLKYSNCRPPMGSGAFSFAFNRTKIAQKEYIIVNAHIQ